MMEGSSSEQNAKGEQVNVHHFHSVVPNSLKRSNEYDNRAKGFDPPDTSANGLILFSIKDSSVNDGPSKAYLVRNGAHEVLKRVKSYHDELVAFHHYYPNKVVTLTDSDVAGMHVVKCIFSTDCDPIFIAKPSSEYMLKLKEFDRMVTSTQMFAACNSL